MCRKENSKMMRRKMEEKQRQNSPIVKEYKKFYIYLNEYEERNLNLLNVNGQLISEKRKLVDS